MLVCPQTGFSFLFACELFSSSGRASVERESYRGAGEKKLSKSYLFLSFPSPTPLRFGSFISPAVNILLAISTIELRTKQRVCGQTKGLSTVLIEISGDFTPKTRSFTGLVNLKIAQSVKSPSRSQRQGKQRRNRDSRQSLNTGKTKSLNLVVDENGNLHFCSFSQGLISFYAQYSRTHLF